MIQRKDIFAIKEYTPTLTEIFYWAILTGAGIIIVLNPKNILFIQGIENNSLTSAPSWIGWLLVLGSPFWLYITKYLRWLRNNSEASGTS